MMNSPTTTEHSLQGARMLDAANGVLVGLDRRRLFAAAAAPSCSLGGGSGGDLCDCGVVRCLIPQLNDAVGVASHRLGGAFENFCDDADNSRQGTVSQRLERRNRRNEQR
jgi:hypothetical protein